MATLVISTDAPVVSGPPQGQWTYADWETLPDDGRRYEIIDGVLYMSTAPSLFHQWIVMALVEYIGMPLKHSGLGFAFPAPIGVLMPGCDPVQPDFVVVLAERSTMLRDRRVRGAPDLIIEILSPGNRAFDERVKLEAYARAGVPEYAIIDPRARMLYCYRLQPTGQYGDPIAYDRNATARFDCLPGITIPIASLFAGAPDTSL
jgi:Uma2 family endonuclease